MAKKAAPAKKAKASAKARFIPSEYEVLVQELLDEIPPSKTLARTIAATLVGKLQEDVSNFLMGVQSKIQKGKGQGEKQNNQLPPPEPEDPDPGF